MIASEQEEPQPEPRAESVLSLSTIPPEGFAAAPEWLRADTLIICALLLVGLATRFWRLATPARIIFDERFTVSQAQNYLRHLPYRDTHPPLAPYLISLGVLVFGDTPWSWRLAFAALGTALIGITYLLGRRMFNSRLAGALAATFVLCDGLFLVDSRFALREIAYLTPAAWSYLIFFQFAQSSNRRFRQRALVLMGVALGFSLSAKFGIPVLAELLNMVFVVFVLVRNARMKNSGGPRRALARNVLGAVELVGGVSVLVYLILFLPNYWFGWWHGVGDQLTYYRREIRGQSSLPHQILRGSPWWSWPLMLRPLLYWKQVTLPHPGIAVILPIGNPIIWWGVIVAMLLVTAQAVTRKSMARAFLVLGYVLYLAMWIPISRYQLLYHYMPALYLGFLALAAVLAECWDGKATIWEHMMLLTPMLPALLLGLGTGGGLLAVALGGGYVISLRHGGQFAGRFVCASFVGSVLVAFVYFFPVWFGLFLSEPQFLARMWFQGPGLANWY